jgi:hypothetical protein
MDEEPDDTATWNELLSELGMYMSFCSVPNHRTLTNLALLTRSLDYRRNNDPIVNRSDTEAILFSMHDSPILKAFGLYKEEV